ncbi:MAG: hypothetical protein EBR82_52700, partial [Caulobacteraceae bacterium]|nr:hypothetical protein [Caulobacteraceae bacterium]
SDARTPTAHTHAAADVTSGTFDNARVNFAAPANIGTTTPAQGFFTNLTASAELQLPTNAPASPSAGDLYRVTNTLRYRDSTNTERLLLNATDNLANLASAATARTNLGLGSAAVAASTDFAAASHNHAASAITSGVLDNARINFAAPSAIGSTTAAAGTFTTLTANNGTLTASAPVLDLAQTWNASGTTFTALRVNVTNTASNASSVLADFQIGGTSICQIRRDGSGGASGTSGLVSVSALRLRDWDFGIYNRSTGGSVANLGPSNADWLALTSTQARFGGGISIGRSGWLGHTMDCILDRDAAATLAQRDGTNAQTFNIYNTFTSATNHERGFLRWSSNVFQ